MSRVAVNTKCITRDFRISHVTVEKERERERENELVHFLFTVTELFYSEKVF